MLILSRKKGEQIVISDDIVLTIVDVDKDRIKIGIDAPKDVKVFRKELIDDTKETNRGSIVVDESILEELENKLSKK